MNNIVIYELNQYQKDSNYMGDFPLLKELALSPNGYYEAFAYGISKQYKNIKNALKFLNIDFDKINKSIEYFEDVTVDLIVNAIDNNNNSVANYWRKQYKQIKKLREVV